MGLRLERIIPDHQLTHCLCAPHKATLFGEIDLCIGRIVESVRPQMKMRCQGLQSHSFQRFCFLTTRFLILTKTEPFQATDEFSFDSHLTYIIYLGQQGLLLFQPPYKHRGAPVYESLCQTRMERI